MFKINSRLNIVLVSAALFLSACIPMSNNGRSWSKVVGASREAVEDARHKVEWVGVYQGIFPCAGCDGIATMLKLNDDMTFALRTRELGREDIDKKSNGKFVWLEGNSKIQLQGNAHERTFRVGDGFLELLGPNGKPVQTKTPEDFVLRKTD